MKVISLFVLILFFIILSGGAYFLWYIFPSTPIEYPQFSANVSNLAANSNQFYPNMRYPDRVISYVIEPACNDRKVYEIEEAFSVLSNDTVLRFQRVESNGEINYLCSEIAPTSEEKGHFIAGEGGPSKIINSSDFYIITSGRVSLYRSDKCSEPKVALHETLHALGFDHNSNPNSIMYPVTNCNQQVDSYIINEINRLYSIDSLPDWAIEKVSAVKRGIYLDFDIVFGNYGLRNAQNAKLEIYSGNTNIKEYEINNTQIGMRTSLDVQNLRANRDSSTVRFEIVSSEAELSKKNNIVELTLNG